MSFFDPFWVSQTIWPSPNYFPTCFNPSQAAMKTLTSCWRWCDPHVQILWGLVKPSISASPKFEFSEKNLLTCTRPWFSLYLPYSWKRILESLRVERISKRQIDGWRNWGSAPRNCPLRGWSLAGKNWKYPKKEENMESGVSLTPGTGQVSISKYLRWPKPGPTVQWTKGYFRVFLGGSCDPQLLM